MSQDEMISLASSDSRINPVELWLSVESMELFFRALMCFLLPLILFFILFLFWLYLRHTCLLVIPAPPCLSCLRTFACAPFYFLFPFKSSWPGSFTFVQVSDEMSWERMMSQLTLLRIKPMPIPSCPPPYPALFFFRTFNTIRHCFFPPRT